jgi:anhydro-N-acetylmuramic acid kinase
MTPRRSRPLRVLGLMSGTSADGIDVALARISGTPPRLNAQFLKFASIPYPSGVRAAILRIAEGAASTAAEISQLNFLIGELFAEAALKACKRFRVNPRSIALIGSHGQTIYHQGLRGPFLGAQVASTLQIGEPAVIAERTGITTVADFRPADMAAGGQGAPLVPFVDYLLYRHPRRGRVALNIGGIANVTVIPPGAAPKNVFAFDTGAGNMVVDALTRHFTKGRQEFDRDAELALRGRLLPKLLTQLLEHRYFRQPPPKTSGREQFGKAFAQLALEWGRKNSALPEDLIRTVTLLTPVSILDAYRRWIVPSASIKQWIVSGGGARNPLMMAILQAGLPGVELLYSDELGVPSAAKEAFAFAILAYEAFHGRTNSIPRATGAGHPAVLGKIIYARAQ